MTANSSAEDAGAGDAGGGAGGAGDAGGGAAGAAGAPDKPFYEAFTSEAVRTSPSVQRYKTVEELAGAYVNLEKRYGIDPNRRIDLPADPKDAEGMRAVYTRLGLPEKPDGYGLKLDDKAADSDKALLAKFTDVAHKAGILPEHARAALEFFVGESNAAKQAAADAAKAAHDAGEAVLRKEWGQAYDQRGQEVGRLLNTYFGPDIAKVLDGKLGDYPELSLGLGKLLDRMAEPGAAPGDPAAQQQGGALTPSQAKAAANAIEANPALRDPSHPQHKTLVAERNRLLAMAEPKAA